MSDAYSSVDQYQSPDSSYGESVPVKDVYNGTEQTQSPDSSYGGSNERPSSPSPTNPITANVLAQQNLTNAMNAYKQIASLPIPQAPGMSGGPEMVTINGIPIQRSDFANSFSQGAQLGNLVGNLVHQSRINSAFQQAQQAQQQAVQAQLQQKQYIQGLWGKALAGNANSDELGTLYSNILPEQYKTLQETVGAMSEKQQQQFTAQNYGILQSIKKGDLSDADAKLDQLIQGYQNSSDPMAAKQLQGVQNIKQLIHSDNPNDVNSAEAQLQMSVNASKYGQQLIDNDYDRSLKAAQARNQSSEAVKNLTVGHYDFPPQYLSSGALAKDTASNIVTAQGTIDTVNSVMSGINKLVSQGKQIPSGSLGDLQQFIANTTSGNEWSGISRQIDQITTGGVLDKLAALRPASDTDLKNIQQTFGSKNATAAQKLNALYQVKAIAQQAQREQQATLTGARKGLRGADLEQYVLDNSGKLDISQPYSTQAKKGSLVNGALGVLGAQPEQELVFTGPDGKPISYNQAFAQAKEKAKAGATVMK